MAADGQGAAHDFLTASFVACGGLPWPAPHLREAATRGGDGTSCTVLLTAHTPPDLGTERDPASATAVATARTYRALSVAGVPDAVILLYPSSTGGGVHLSGARSWATPLGHVQVAADICEMLSGTVGCSETEAGIPARHAPWLWFTAAQYDCERRENIVVPQLAAVGVDEALTAEEPTAAKLTQAIVTAVRSVAPRRRVAIIAAVEALDGEPHGNLTMIALRCAEAIVGAAPKPYTLGTSGEEPLGPWICTAVASSPCPAPASAGLDASTSTTKLYRYTEGSGWGAPLRWAENHGPCSCDDPASSWGRPQEFHDAAVRFADNELHAIWTPALSAPDAGTGSSAPLSRGVLVTCPGAGASAGPCGAFGPFCIFSRLARSLREHGVSTLQIIYPQWSAGKPSVAVNALRRATELLSRLQPRAAIVALGWSMGGAAAIEGCGRIIQPCPSVELVDSPVVAADLPTVAGIITLASQASGLHKVGNGRGRTNSVRANLTLLGNANTPLVCIVGTADNCVNPNQTELVADWWGAKLGCKVTKIVEEGDDHGVRSAAVHVPEHVLRMLSDSPGHRRPGT